MARVKMRVAEMLLNVAACVNRACISVIYREPCVKEAEDFVVREAAAQSVVPSRPGGPPGRPGRGHI